MRNNKSCFLAVPNAKKSLCLCARGLESSAERQVAASVRLGKERAESVRPRHERAESVRPGHGREVHGSGAWRADAEWSGAHGHEIALLTWCTDAATCHSASDSDLLAHGRVIFFALGAERELDLLLHA